MLISLVASCKANQVEPFAYLRELFQRMPTQPSERLDELLPDKWLAENPNNRWEIDQIRQQERQRR